MAEQHLGSACRKSDERRGAFVPVRGPDEFSFQKKHFIDVQRLKRMAHRKRSFMHYTMRLPSEIARMVQAPTWKSDERREHEARTQGRNPITHSHGVARGGTHLHCHPSITFAHPHRDFVDRWPTAGEATPRQPKPPSPASSAERRYGAGF